MPYRAVTDIIGGGVGSYPSYRAPINVRASSNRAANLTWWGLYNGGTKTVVVRHLSGLCNFDGTGATATTVFNVVRFTGTSLSGGAVTIINDDSYEVAATASCHQVETGVTIGGSPTYAILGTIAMNLAYSGTTITFNALGGDDECVVLHPGEGLGLRIAVQANTGFSLSGTCLFHEM